MGPDRFRAPSTTRQTGRLEAIYAEANDLRHQFGIPIPPRGKAKRPTTDLAGGSVAGKKVADIPILLAEWDWDANLDLDPFTLPASSKERASWRCALNPEHTWDTRTSARVYDSSFCPYHIGVKVHPAESLAAYFPDLVPEWHPTRNVLHPHEVSRSSAREIALGTRSCTGRRCVRSRWVAPPPRSDQPIRSIS